MQQKNNLTSEFAEKSNSFLDFFGLTKLNTLLKKIRKYAKKHFDRFSAIFVAVTTIGIWITRAFGYAYQSAKLSVYNIDKSYVSLDDNFFLQIIEFIAIVIFCIAVNYIYFCVATKQDNTKFHLKRKCRKLFLYIIEMLLILAFVILQMNYGINGFIKEVQSYSFVTWISLIIILLLAVYSFNIFGIQIAHLKHKKQKNGTFSSSEDKTASTRLNKQQFSLIKAMLIFLSILLIISHLWGIFEENNRTTFKVIQEQAEDYLTDSTVFKFNDNTSYFLYAVVYENEDVYILCQLYKSENGILINKNYQRIVSKDNLVTYNVINIYKIRYIN